MLAIRQKYFFYYAGVIYIKSATFYDKHNRYFILLGTTCSPIQKINYSQTCIKRSPFGTKKKLPYKTCELLKKVQFI